MDTKQAETIASKIIENLRKQGLDAFSGNKNYDISDKVRKAILTELTQNKT